MPAPASTEGQERAMTAAILNRRDLAFVLYEWLGLEALLQREPFTDHSRQTIDAALDLSERLAETTFLPHYKESDRHEPKLTEAGVTVLPAIREALQQCAAVGLFSAGFDAALGGLQFPCIASSASLGLLMGANISTAAYVMLTVASARLIARFGTPAQIDAFAKPQIAGEMLGTMCLSEPQAGSSLADITTRAIEDGADALGRRFRLTGNKMWISGGDHDVTANIVHLVLAKVPGADRRLTAGTKGLSLFIVPKYLDATGRPEQRNDVAVAGLNHKMGYRGTTNCLLNFGEGASRPDGVQGAVGYLLGEVGQGLPIMFHMMNEARIAVGLGAAMLACRGYLLALDYARERPQGRPLAARDPTLAPVAIIAHADVKRMLLAQKAYAEGALALVLYCARLVDDERTAPDAAERERAGKLLGLLTPIAKTWPSEWGLAANDLAIQVHGGYGYSRDFDVEQLYRDNRLNPIHEGTTGIQALDLVGRKILHDHGVALGLLQERVAACVALAGRRGQLRAHAEHLAAAWARIGAVCDRLAGLNNDVLALRNATPFLSAFGHAVVAWLWLEKAVLCDEAVARGRAGTEYYLGKLRACRYFFEWELPKIEAWLSVVHSLNDVAAEMPPDQF
jgi:alkylation response protein AidB-like acyl-CoA dehydrogenase